MKKLFLILLLALPLLTPAAVEAQTAKPKVKSDTALAGCYLLPDPNTMSFKFMIIHNSVTSVERVIQGNALPADLAAAVMRLPKGDIVLYDEVTILDGTVMRKAPAIRYVIGNRNTRAALPFTLTPEAAAAMALDTNVVSFGVAFAVGGTFYEYKCKGNTVSPEGKEALLKLERGTKIFYEMILAKGENGEEIKLPAQQYIIE